MRLIILVFCSQRLYLCDFSFIHIDLNKSHLPFGPIVLDLCELKLVFKNRGVLSVSLYVF